MAYNSIQSFIVNARNRNRDVMTALNAARDVVDSKTKSVHDLTQDDLAVVAAGCYEDCFREEGSEAMELHDLNSDVNTALIKFLTYDKTDSRDQLCDAIQKAFITYFDLQIIEAVDEAIEERSKHNPFEEDTNEFDF